MRTRRRSSFTFAPTKDTVNASAFAVGTRPAAWKRGTRMAWDHLKLGIRAHSEWVGALIRHVESGGSAPVELPLDETHCETGRWIAEVAREYAEIAEFERLRTVHSAFHDCAQSIVALAESGDTHGAFQLMQPDGDFARLSIALIMAFDALDEQAAADDRQ